MASDEREEPEGWAGLIERARSALSALARLAQGPAAPLRPCCRWCGVEVTDAELVEWHERRCALRHHCPRCGAPAREVCRTPAGRSTRHKARVDLAWERAKEERAS